jgi:TolB-like protein/Flp pilus assembly protein TadD
MLLYISAHTEVGDVGLCGVKDGAKLSGLQVGLAGMQGFRSSGPIVRFGAFELDEKARELRKAGKKIRLQEQPLQVLQILLEQPGTLVTREELRKRVWPTDTFVDFDHGINNAINRLREALADSAESPEFVETLARRGYRFIGSLAAVEPAPAAIPSIAVLPLENLSRDPEQEYFSEGLTEALITALAKIGMLRVVSRTSIMQYKGVHKPLREIARELEVDFVVEGSVLRVGRRVRITAQLIDAPNETHLWAESYERDLRNVLALQSELAHAIAQEVRVKLTPRERKHLAQTRAVEPEAYEAYLKGRYHWNRRSGDGLGKATQHFQQAIASDPTYATAYAGLADCVSILGWWGFVPPEHGCGRGKALAQKALEFDPHLPEAHTSFAWSTAYYDYDFPKCEREFRRAIELNSNYATARGWYGLTLSMIGDYEEALVEAKHAVRLDPASSIINGMLGLVYWFGGEYDASLDQYKKASDLDPAGFQLHWGVGLSYLAIRDYDAAIAEMETALQLTGRTPMSVAFLAASYAAAERGREAEQLLNELAELSTVRYVSPYVISWVFAAMKQSDKAIAQLEAGYRERAAWMVWMNRDLRLETLRSDPRFKDLLRRMNFPK